MFNATATGFCIVQMKFDEDMRPVDYMIVEGNPINTAKALELKAIDAVIEGDLLAGSVAFAEEVVAGKRPMNQISEAPLGLPASEVFEEWQKTVAKKYRGMLAPAHCIKAVRAACELPLDKGIERERELTLELLASPQSLPSSESCS